MDRNITNSGRNHLEDVKENDGRIILKQMLKNVSGSM
jgi:hypothetical protein